MIKWFQSKINDLWSNYDILVKDEQLCKDPQGKAQYRRGQLYWKTIALIGEDQLMVVKEMV